MSSSDHLPLPQAQYHVLVALTSGAQHGYAIMQAVEDSSGGVVRMGPATLYGTLKRLCDSGSPRSSLSAPILVTTSAAVTTGSPGSGVRYASPSRTGWTTSSLAVERTFARGLRDMTAGASVYRALVRLYPRDFRSEFGDDLDQVFADLVAQDGVGAAWRRTAVDFAVTVPRYRLESFMSSRRSTAVLVH